TALAGGTAVPRPLRDQHAAAGTAAATGRAPAGADPAGGAQPPARPPRPARRARPADAGLALRPARVRPGAVAADAAARLAEPGAAQPQSAAALRRPLPARAAGVLRQHRRGDTGAEPVFGEPERAAALPAHDKPARTREPRRVLEADRLKPDQ